MLIYDIEIKKAIPPKDGTREVGVEYCDGWNDHANMGVSVVCAYDYDFGEYRVFCSDNSAELKELLDAQDLVIGYNSIRFDNAVMACHGIQIEEKRSYDLLREIWAAAGLGPDFRYPSHAGYSLGAVAVANGLPDKTNSGAYAPVLWQQGKIGTVIDYCLHDVWLTKCLLDRVMEGAPLINPKGGSLNVRSPLCADRKFERQQALSLDSD